MNIDVDPPSKQELGVMTAVAVGLAALVLVFAVLPAEYGIDPTGFGTAIGLTDDGAATTADTFNAQDARYRTESFVIEVPSSGAWRETKLDMLAGMTFVFSWNATGLVQYDLHHDTQGSFDAGEATARAGSFSAPADGPYGWAFRSPTGDAQTIVLEVTGYWLGSE